MTRTSQTAQHTTIPVAARPRPARRGVLARLLEADRLRREKARLVAMEDERLEDIGISRDRIASLYR